MVQVIVRETGGAVVRNERIYVIDQTTK
jgi:hypothetical protein